MTVAPRAVTENSVAGATACACPAAQYDSWTDYNAVRPAGVRCPQCRSWQTWQSDGVCQCWRCGHTWDADDGAVLRERRARWEEEQRD